MREDKDYSRNVTLKCLFCGSDLQAEEDVEFESGDMIKCIECGEENDYDSVLNIAVDNGTQEIADEVKKDIEKELKKWFK